MRIYYPVFTWVPDFTERPKYGTVTASERTGLAPAKETYFFPQTQPDRTFAHNFTFFDADAIDAVREFFRARGGRNGPFYLPSWRPELPAITGASGSNLLTVLAPAYPFGDHADAAGRQIFIWQPGQALFTSAVISATEGLHGHAELNLERWLPFTVDPKTAVCGFLHLARFEDDEITYSHFSAEHAQVAIAFRGIRQWNGEENLWELTPTTITPVGTGATVLGFETAEQAAEEFDPPDNRVSYALGPAVLHTAEAYPFPELWVAWANADGIRLQIAPVPAFGQTVPDPAGAVNSLVAGFLDTAHVSLAFMATGWEVLAYQRTASSVRVWIKLPTVPTSYDFDGCDPLLFNMGNIDGTVDPEDAVIACYYRKPADNRLYARFSSDLFATEFGAALLPAKPLQLRRIYVDGRRLLIDYLDAGMRRVTLTSAEYPAFP